MKAERQTNRRNRSLLLRRTGKLKSFVMGLIAVVVLNTACDGDSTVSRRYPCHFTFHTEWHPASMIVTSLNTYNYFVKISMTTYGTAYVVNTADRRDSTERITLTNELENRPFTGGIYLGAGADKGVIILGRTNFNGLVAWDGQCPNCATGYTTRYPLQWTDTETSVRCNTCKRTYSLETGAIISGDRGDRLMQYIVSYAGSGVLGIGN